MPKILVAVATYNEIENLPTLAEEIFQSLPDCRLLVIDDNSPDGTGQWCDQQSSAEPRLHCIHRSQKLGLGTATVTGMRFAVQQGYDLIVTMDADFSHDPQDLPRLISALQTDPSIDVAIGSRYVRGGRTLGWPVSRRAMSRGMNCLAQICLGLNTKDCTGAFRVYRVSRLAELDLDQIQSPGYSYLEEILWRLQQHRAAFCEIPITFTDRKRGNTKINLKESAQAVAYILRFGLRHRIGV